MRTRLAVGGIRWDQCGLNQELGRVGHGPEGQQSGAQYVHILLSFSQMFKTASDFKTASATHNGQPFSRGIWQNSEFKMYFYFFDPVGFSSIARQIEGSKDTILQIVTVVAKVWK